MAKNAKAKRKVSIKKNLITKCRVNECKKVAKNKCQYCGRRYCIEHTEARLATNPRAIWEADRNNPLWNELAHEWTLIDGHICANYTELRYKKYREESSKYDIDWNAIIERRSLRRTTAFPIEPNLKESKSETQETQYTEVEEQEGWYKRHEKIVNIILVILVVVLLLLMVFGF